MVPLNFLDKKLQNSILKHRIFLISIYTYDFKYNFLVLVFGLCQTNSIPPLLEGRRGGAAVTLPVSEFSTWSRHDGLEEREDESDEALIYCGGIDNFNRKVFHIFNNINFLYAFNDRNRNVILDVLNALNSNDRL